PPAILTETSCRSRTVGPRSPARAGATPRGSLAAFLWPTGRLPRRFRGSPARWPQRRRAGLSSHRGSGVGSEQAGHCSWHPPRLFERVRASVTLLQRLLRGISTPYDLTMFPESQAEYCAILTSSHHFVTTPCHCSSLSF